MAIEETEFNIERSIRFDARRAGQRLSNSRSDRNERVEIFG
jgi:hypothetical protein